MILGAFELATVLELVCFTYISLSVLATVCDALPVSTAALVVFACISGSGGDVAVGYLVWMVLGICFRCDLVVLHFFSYDFWVRDLIQNSVCDPNILAIRHQCLSWHYPTPQCTKDRSVGAPPGRVCYQRDSPAEQQLRLPDTCVSTLLKKGKR